MRVKVVRMRKNGVEIERRALRELYAHPGDLIITDVTDQGLRRPVKVGRLVQNGVVRYELTTYVLFG